MCIRDSPHTDRRRTTSPEGATLLIGLHDLPALNATLNGTAAVLLIIAFILIKQRRIQAHKRVMITAFIVSSLFLISYLIYHAQVGSVHYPHTGTIRTVYLTILTTHTILAVPVPVLALVT